MALVDQGATRLGGFPQQLLDPISQEFAADGLTMADDELGGFGTMESAGHVDVDEIIPTLSHTPMDVVDGEIVSTTAAGEELAATAEDPEVPMDIESTGVSSDNLSNRSSSSSSNNNVNQNESEKDNLKIKITMKDGQTKVTTSSSSSSGHLGSSSGSKSSSSKSSSKSSSEKRSSSGDKERKKSSSSSKSSSSGHKSSSSSSSSSKRSSSTSSSKSSSRDKDRERSSSHKSSSSSTSSSSKGSSTSSSSSSSRSKEASVSQADKDKDTLSKVMGSGSATLEKLGKIPKKPKTEEATGTAPAAPAPAKKSSISIEVRKDPENRPKTVKTFNSQFRNHGLVEDIPPPPSRKTLKKPDTAASTALTAATHKSSSSASTTGSLKRASPPKDTEGVPSSPVAEKRIKLDQLVATSPSEEKPGGVKLIAPRAKRKYSLEVLLSALCAMQREGISFEVYFTGNAATAVDRYSELRTFKNKIKYTIIVALI